MSAPTPPAKAVRILFQGDSITDAFRRPDEVNPAFQLGNGYVFLVASEMAASAPGRFEFLNRGISGQTIHEMELRWEFDAVALRPDVLSILAGVNTTIREMLDEEVRSADDVRTCYSALIAAARSARPGLKLVLIEPFLLEQGLVTKAWLANLEVHQRTIRALAEESQAVFVPAQEVFTAALSRAPAAHWLYDGIHPTAAGARILADAWIAATRSLFWGESHD